MALPSLTLTGATNLLAGYTSSSAALPLAGSPSTAPVSNLGDSVVYVLLGGADVTVDATSGVAILPGQSVGLGLISRWPNTIAERPLNCPTRSRK